MYIYTYLSIFVEHALIGYTTVYMICNLRLQSLTKSYCIKLVFLSDYFTSWKRKLTFV